MSLRTLNTPALNVVLSLMAELPLPHTGPWTLKAWEAGDLGRPYHGRKVFSIFHCGGGSTMGYKLAGFNVLGGVEIDEKMMGIYRKNLGSDFSYLMPVQDFKTLPNISPPLFDLDILDGSPPCSTFSMSGNREKDWGKARKFTEGQKEQVLDDLFFHFIDVAKRLRPKMVIAENVKGLLQGNARGYVSEILRQLGKAGYETQLFLLDASLMGVPQKRERVFFISRRCDLNLPKVEIPMNEKPISVEEAFKGIDPYGPSITASQQKMWDKLYPGGRFSTVHPKGHYFAYVKLHPHQPSPTRIANSSDGIHMWDRPTKLSDAANNRIQTFPDDYDFCGVNSRYITGMSVPPLMMQRIALACARALTYR